ncbi:hypothetical protein HY389_01335, partial [Candidatus Daviesbacteria bacterium]|nr:hypothetical protein [Candidatus Daviesbacteria bacterium]
MSLMSFLKRLLPILVFGSIFALVVYSVTPPKSWNEASIFQIMAFFLPLLLALTIFLDFFIRYLPHSFILSLGLILGLSFYAVNQLSILSGLLVILITSLSWRVFPKMKLPRFRLTGKAKIPKLHLAKRQPP